MSKKTKKQSVKIDIVQSMREFAAFSESIRKMESDILKDDRLAVIILGAGVESVLNFLVRELFVHGSEFSKMPFMKKVYLLDEFGVIDNKILKNLKSLKDLRNEAAHTLDVKLDWKNKFAFDKNSVVYKATIEKFGKPKGLLGRLYLVWNIFIVVTMEYVTKWKFGIITGQIKKFTNNNK